VSARKFTLADQLKAARRECGLRGRVYPRAVSQGRLSPDSAEFELGAMRAIVHTLARLVDEHERPLFPDPALEDPALEDPRQA